MIVAQGEEFLITDVGLLGSALARPQTSAFGEDAYSSLQTKAAALMHSLARNHALVDGNKRMAWAASKLFLRFNDVALRAPSPDAGERLVLDVAEGKLDVPQIADQLEQWSAPA